MTVVLPAQVCKQLAEVAADPAAVCRIDLESQQLMAGPVTADFAIDGHTKHLLLDGLDDIGLTLQHEGDITAFEASRSEYLPAT